LVEVKGLEMNGVDSVPLIVGVVTSAIVGYAAIKLLLKTILLEKFHWFAFYCFALGIVVLFML
jgi:undecaprenyl-diphosphatase